MGHSDTHCTVTDQLVDVVYQNRVNTYELNVCCTHYGTAANGPHDVTTNHEHIASTTIETRVSTATQALSQTVDEFMDSCDVPTTQCFTGESVHYVVSIDEIHFRETQRKEHFSTRVQVDIDCNTSLNNELADTLIN
ncbi:hypothetical protein D3C84_941870 [compost metagenome]